MLIGARFVQGVGGAMASAGILGMIVTMFPDPREQAKAIGVYSFVAAAGASIGLLAGGVLTEAISWHWIFFVNLPIGDRTAVLADRLLEPDRGIGLGQGADVPGAVLVTGSLMLGVYTIVEAADYGWGSARTLGLGAGRARAARRVRRPRARAANPLMPLRIFRSRNVSGANAVQVLMVAGLFGMFFLGALYLQRVLGYDAVEVGLAFLPVDVGIGAFSLTSRRRWSPGSAAGAALLAGPDPRRRRAGAFTRVPVDGSYLDRHPADGAAVRHRRRALLPGADDPGDVRRDPERRRPRVGPRQHDPAGRRRARTRRARDALDVADRGPARRR